MAQPLFAHPPPTHTHPITYHLPYHVRAGFIDTYMFNEVGSSSDVSGFYCKAYSIIPKPHAPHTTAAYSSTYIPTDYYISHHTSHNAKCVVS